MNNLILPPDKNQNPVPVLSIGLSQDVTNSTYICTNGVVRITAITESRIWYYKTIESGSGMLLPAGASIDVSITMGNIIKVTGSINLTNYI